MNATATLSSRFQIVVPKAVRDALRWKAGQSLAFLPKSNGVLLIPAPELAELAGIAKGARRTGYRDRADLTNRIAACGQPGIRRLKP